MFKPLLKYGVLLICIMVAALVIVSVAKAQFPIIDYLEPEFGPPGIGVSIIGSFFGEKMSGDSVQMGQLVEVITDLCGNDNGICDPGEAVTREPHDGRGNDNCICEPSVCVGGTNSGLWCLNNTECPGGGTCTSIGADVVVTPSFNYHVDCANGCRWDYMTVPSYSWFDGQIDFVVPEDTFDLMHNTNLRVVVVKANDLISNFEVFTIRQHPEIYNIDPASGGYGEGVVINGTGFGYQFQEINFLSHYGFRTYVELHTEANVYRVTEYQNNPIPPPKSWSLNPNAVWSPTQIEVKLEDLLDVNTGKILTDIYKLNEDYWDVMVVTDYFKDDGDFIYLLGPEEIIGDGIGNDDGVCDTAERIRGGCYGQGRIDPDDILLYRDISNSVYFTVTDIGGPVVECTLVPDAMSIPRGGTLGFLATIINNTEEIQVFKFATRITKPNGGKAPLTGFLKGPVWVRLAPHDSGSRHISHFIPSTAPLGTYTYHGYVGRYGNIYDECQFNFTVTE